MPDTPPLLYVGGESEPGRALGAESADVFFINGRPFPDTIELIEDMRARPREGAPLRFGLSGFVIARDTEAEAIAESEYLQGLSDAETRPEISGGTDPKTQMYKVLSGTRRVGSNGGWFMVKRMAICERAAENGSLSADRRCLSASPSTPALSQGERSW